VINGYVERQKLQKDFCRTPENITKGDKRTSETEN
jgi:hypothetical protein